MRPSTSVNSRAKYGDWELCTSSGFQSDQLLPGIVCSQFLGHRVPSLQVKLLVFSIPLSHDLMQLISVVKCVRGDVRRQLEVHTEGEEEEEEDRR